MVSQALLTELQVIIQEEYGLNLSAQEVSEVGNNLVRFFEILAKIEHDSKGGD